MENKPLLHLFEENELNISKLYAIYAEKIPAKESFWSRLSSEEAAHAINVSEGKHATDSEAPVVENKFSRGIIRYVMDFVLEEIHKAHNYEVSHREALCTALRIERSMLEKKCFDIFTPSSETVKNVLCRLNNETERHIEILLQEMKRNKFALEKQEA
ncbi:MAG TPA: hypothetical protein DCX32_04175 [Candidatus Moranbacteria bacterium]|nr:MAG: hypothetical protein UW87_C0008G0015 [Candidatus Moranbacteria bacterium GW2011_GWC2_45_10]KKT93065.1 MAG: hypothetical protein UW95_C0026G0006 [Parcubacteria group bacterium GW2011_GWC1_45_14]HAV11704.1 hypothetical protein [Candidatus Moranbacteria bacterium]